jgi:hypothetical protein
VTFYVNKLFDNPIAFCDAWSYIVELQWRT